MSLLGYTWQCGLKHTDIKLQTLQDKDLILKLEIIIRGGISSITGDRYVKSDEKKIIYNDVNISYGWALSQMLPFDEIELWHGCPDLYMKKLIEILKTEHDGDIG